MSFCDLSGQAVFQATISLPRTGVWRADLLVAEDVAPTGSVTLNFGSSSWKGSVYRGGAPYGTGLLRIVGGAGGLGSGKKLPAKSYQGATISIPLQEILAECGETLSQTSDKSVLSQQLAQWTRAAGPAGNSLSQLLSATGASWRFLPDGTLWIGMERWPADSATWTLIVDRPEHGKQVLYSDDPTTKPGSSLEGRRVSYIEHFFSEDKLRSSIWFEDAQPGRLDRIKSAFAAFVRAVRPVDALTKWSGLVVSQSGSTCDFQGDDARIGGLQNVKIYWGEPGVELTVDTPARAILGYLNGDLSKPYIAGWEDGTTFSNLAIIGGTEGAARNGDLVAIDADAVPPGPPAALSMAQWVAAVTTALVTGGTSTGGPIDAVLVGPSNFGKISSASTKVQVG